MDNKMIGRFSCLSCADQANITSYYNGKKYSYLMYKNGGGINIDAIGSPVDGDFKNGLEVSVVTKVSNNSLKEALFELQFFDMLYIEYKQIDSSNNDIIEEFIDMFNSERQFPKFKHISFTLQSDYRKFVKMGNVLYSIQTDKFAKFFKSSYIVPNVPVGSIDITPNRESVIYTEKTIVTINEAITYGRNEFSNYCNESMKKNVNSIRELYQDIICSYRFKVKVMDKVYDVDKEDIFLQESNFRIKDNPIPHGFITFVTNASSLGLDSKDFYKNINMDKKRYGSGFNGCLKGDWFLGIKKDTVTKSGTIEYFIHEHPNLKIRICDEDKFNALKKYVKNLSNDMANKDECCDFLFDNLSIFTLSNADTPEEWLVPTARRVVATDDDNIRVYNEYGYRLDKFSEREEVKGKGIIIYSRHTREDEELKALGAFVSSYTKDSVISLVFTAKESLCKKLEKDKRFVSLTDFMTEKQKFFVKVIEKQMILANLESVKNFKNLPIYRTFCQDYRNYIGLNMTELRDLEKAYINNGWIRQYKVDQYKASVKDQETYLATIGMLDKINTICKCSISKIINNPTYSRMSVHIANNINMFADMLNKNQNKSN